MIVVKLVKLWRCGGGGGNDTRGDLATSLGSRGCCESTCSQVSTILFFKWVARHVHVHLAWQLEVAYPFRKRSSHVCYHTQVLIRASFNTLQFYLLQRIPFPYPPSPNGDNAIYMFFGQQG